MLTLTENYIVTGSFALNIILATALLLSRVDNKKLKARLRTALKIDNVLWDAMRVINIQAKGHDPLREARTALMESGKIAAQHMGWEE